MLFFSCTNETSSKEDPKTDAEAVAKKDKEVKVIRLPVEINPSLAKDYPEDLLALGFPVLPSAEIKNVGNTRILEEGLLMQLNTYDEQADVVDYYQKEMAALGWKEGKINVYKGASKGLKFDKEGLTCRLIIIDDKDIDYRKIAVNVVKSLDTSKF